jgi:hypothetical protein
MAQGDAWLTLARDDAWPIVVLGTVITVLLTQRRGIHGALSRVLRICVRFPGGEASIELDSALPAADTRAWFARPMCGLMAPQPTGVSVDAVISAMHPTEVLLQRRGRINRRPPV